MRGQFCRVMFHNKKNEETSFLLSRRKKKEEMRSSLLHFFSLLFPSRALERQRETPRARANTRESKREKNMPSRQTQKRRVGERDLWDTIVNNDDICFEHILPKLNGTDVKFLFEVNGETRALIKRSSRKSELKKSFKVSEMSSISTLEFAWENQSFWPSHWDERCFCRGVARTNKLELLKWAREEKKCEWCKWTINKAAIQGNIEMVKYCVANKCPMDETSCVEAAYNGHLECLKYLHEVAKAPCGTGTADTAAEYGQLHVLEYLVERKFDDLDEYTCECAARKGHSDCLKFLHETAKAPWDSHAVRYAHKYNRLECLQYLLDNDCPLPDGWFYDGGVLIAASESEEESEEDQD